MAGFVLPKTQGKVDKAWLSKKRIGKKLKTLQSFSGAMLTIVTIMAAYLMDNVQDPGHALYDHMKCFVKLAMIINILQMGPDGAVPYVGMLRRLINQHAEDFARLYPKHRKPKWHHLFHIADGIEFLNKLLSCFVTERKHRMAKRAALHIFRGI